MRLAPRAWISGHALQGTQLDIAVRAPTAAVEGDDQRAVPEQLDGVYCHPVGCLQPELRHLVAFMNRSLGDPGVGDRGHRCGAYLSFLRAAQDVCPMPLCGKLVF